MSARDRLKLYRERWREALAQCGGRQAEAEALILKRFGRYEWPDTAEVVFATGLTPKPAWRRIADGDAEGVSSAGTGLTGGHSLVRAVVLQTVSGCEKTLGRQSQAVERDSLLELAENALELQESQFRAATVARVNAVRYLDRKLAGMSPGDRAAEIQRRLGVGKSRFYLLRKLAFPQRRRKRRASDSAPRSGKTRARL